VPREGWEHVKLAVELELTWFRFGMQALDDVIASRSERLVSRGGWDGSYERMKDAEERLATFDAFPPRAWWRDPVVWLDAED
jgi:hypothetical protein